MKKLKAIELFCGIGGFRVGFERIEGKPIEVIWSNDMLPDKKRQTPSEVYIKNFGDKEHVNKDIHEIKTSDIPDHDLMTAGFPCQDYSVANSKTGDKGIEGKRGILWWQIYRVIKEKGNKKPSYLMLENVDRILRSPSHQRGRDMAIILTSLNEMGYAVEWRVVNSGEYGFDQRRKRIFIIGYHKRTKAFNKIKECPYAWILQRGVTTSSFPITIENKNDIKSETQLSERNPSAFKRILSNLEESDQNIKFISDFFNKPNKKGLLKEAGIMISSNTISYDIKEDPREKKGKLKNVLLNDNNVDDRFFVETQEELDKWKKEKGAKKKKRVSKDGYEYTYSEGGMNLFEDLEKPSRTIITGEGGNSPSRFKHLIKNGKTPRRLTPVELERLFGFPEGFTEGLSDTQRAFLLGNSIITGIPKKLAENLLKLN